MPKYLGEILSFIILITLVLLMITGGQIWYELSMINSYRSNVVKMAQRSDGFTPELKTQMNDLGDYYYGNRMQVAPMQQNGKDEYQHVNYGHDMGFYIVPNITRFDQVFLGGFGKVNGNQKYYIKTYVASQARDNSFNYQSQPEL